MNSVAFMSAVKQEIARLQQIQSLLESESASAPSAKATKLTSGRRGGMSEAGKARVAEAQRKRWAAKKAAAEAESAPTKKQAAAPVKKSAKTAAAVPPAKKQAATATKPAAQKAVATAKKTPVKKSATATKSAAAKKVPAAKKTGGQAVSKKQIRNVPKQPEPSAHAEATEANAPELDAAASVPEETSSNE